VNEWEPGVARESQPVPFGIKTLSHLRRGEHILGRMGTVPLLGRLRGTGAARAVPDDEITAELTADYWAAYDARMASVGFRDVARRFPGLVGQAVRLGWSASRVDISATITLNVIAGVFTGFALLATTGVLEALFAEGPTPQRVRAALPSLILVALATAARAGVSAAAGWAQSRLEPQVDQAVEVRLFDLTS
jgi:ATP-binding cassette, subfamily B, bacterial